MSTTAPLGVHSPHACGLRYKHKNPEIRVLHVAYLDPEMSAYFPGLVVNPPNAQAPPVCPGDAPQQWQILSLLRKGHGPILRADGDVVAISQQTYNALSFQEKCVFWPTFNNSVHKLTRRFTLRAAEAGIEELQPSEALEREIRRVAQRAAARALEGGSTETSLREDEYLVVYELMDAFVEGQARARDRASTTSVATSARRRGREITLVLDADHSRRSLVPPVPSLPPLSPSLSGSFMQSIQSASSSLLPLGNAGHRFSTQSQSEPQDVRSSRRSSWFSLGSSGPQPIPIP